MNEWFSKYLGKEGVRLFQYHPSFVLRPTNSDGRRKDDEKYRIIFQNKSALHLVNETSIKDLNQRFTQGTIDHKNFRPNVLVDYSTAYDEDKWKNMIINNVELLQILHCDRCNSTTVNQETGKLGLETLKALSK